MANVASIATSTRSDVMGLDPQPDMAMVVVIRSAARRPTVRSSTMPQCLAGAATACDRRADDEVIHLDPSQRAVVRMDATRDDRLNAVKRLRKFLVTHKAP